MSENIIFELNRSEYPFLCILASLQFTFKCTFLNTFSGLLYKTCISCYPFSERLNFAVSKIDKMALNNLNEEEHG